MRQFDVLVIGAGAVGNAIARELTKKNTNTNTDKITVGVLEKEPDTAFGTSGRNSGVLHAGFNNKPGSLMAKLCVMGSQGFEKEAEELKLPFEKTGKLVIARHEEDRERLNKLKEQGEANGVRELRIIDREELTQIAGYEAGVCALWSGMTGIFDPFQYAVALAEAAASQGTEYFFGRQVTEITSIMDTADLMSDGFKITAENLVNGQKEIFHTKILINSAGLFADEICRMVGIYDYEVYPCRGEYHILSKVSQPLDLDENQSKLLEIPIYPIPNEKEGGLGVHLTPTIHGNIMIGPSAEYMDKEQDREDYSTTQAVMAQLSKEGVDLLPGLDGRDCIRSFAGVRPKLVSEKQGGYADFVIEESKQVPGFIQLVGIESPGLTSSIPIGKMVAQIVEDIGVRESVRESEAIRARECISDFQPSEVKSSHLVEVHDKQKNQLEQRTSSLQDPGDQKMLCRCEGITEEAVLAAYDSIVKLGAIPTVKGLKNRTRVTMGNCQGSFCTLNIIELLRKKRNVDPLSLLWNGFGSRLLEGSVRE